MAGKADFFADGQWNFYCDFCGAKTKSSDGMRTWNNFYVCKHHKELRNPQDFIRGVRENMSLPWTRPEAANQFVGIHYTRSFSETLRLQEVLGKSLSLGTIAETLLVEEALHIGNTEVSEDILNISESFTLYTGKNLTDGIEMEEAFSLHAGKTLSDSVETLEVISFSVAKTFAEELAIAEEVTLTHNIFDPRLLNGDVLNSQLLG